MSKVVRKEQCPNCLDSGKDNLAVYEDGSKYCFGCGKAGKKVFVDGKIMELKSRRIDQETCRHYSYQVGQYTGTIGKRQLEDEWVRIVNYYDNSNKLIAQKLKTVNKEMKLVGNGKSLPLYGQWKWQPNEKLFITITEGEEDALAISQVQSHQFPVVSLPNGAQAAEKSIKENLNYLLGFKYVVLAFDNDEAGADACSKCLTLFEPGKARVVNFNGFKDANDMLLQGKDKELKDAIYRAKVIEPDHIVSVEQIIDKVLVQPQFGMDYPWKSLTNITYGYQPGEIHVVVASTGVGKTEYIKEILFHLLDKDMKVGLFSFEQNPDNTVRRLVGAKLGLKLHLPGSDWNAAKIKEEALKFNEKIYLYDKAGKVDVADLFNSIRYLARVKDVSFFVVDNLKALGLSSDYEKAEDFMNGLKGLCKELNVTTVLLSHVAKDKYGQTVYTTTSPKDPDKYFSQTAEETDAILKKPGLDWESGRMPTIANVEGGGIITQLADYVFALARNSTSEDREESKLMRVKALKTRLDSSYTGKVFKLTYTHEGKLEEIGNVSINFNSINSSSPF